MYKIVYVIIEHEDFKYIEQLSLSFRSLRYWMPDVNVEIVTDQLSFESIKASTFYSCFNGNVVFNVVDIPVRYGVKQRSRFLKTSLRELVKGDYLYIDTDTVVCRTFPTAISEDDIALVLDLNDYPENLFMPHGIDYCYEQCGIEIPVLSCFYNTGVIWVKDSAYAHRVYALWHAQWKVSVECGKACLDQPALHRVIKDNGLVIGLLDNVWNCQIAYNPFPINLLNNTYIIHYFNSQESLLNIPKINFDDYDLKVEDFIKNPTVHFKKIYSVDYELDKKFYRSSIYNLSHKFYLFFPKSFEFMDKAVSSLYYFLLFIKNIVKKVKS